MGRTNTVRIFEHGAFGRPSATQSFPDGLHGDRRLLRPLDHEFRLSSNRQRTVRSSIVILLCPRRPSNIPGFVMPVHVDSIDRMLGTRSETDVLEKSLEAPTTTPLDRNEDPASAVTREVRNALVRAATDHRCPGTIFDRGSTNLRLSVPDLRPLRASSTSPARASRELVTEDLVFCAARTPTEPARVPPRVMRRPRDDRPLTVRGTDFQFARKHRPRLSCRMWREETP